MKKLDTYGLKDVTRQCKQIPRDCKST